MVSPACLKSVRGLGGAAGRGSATEVCTTGSTLTGARRVFILTGSAGTGVGARVGAGMALGVGAGKGSGGSSMILRLRGAESKDPLGLPRPRLATANCSELSELSANCWELSGNCSELSCGFSELSDASAIYSYRNKIIEW